MGRKEMASSQRFLERMWAKCVAEYIEWTHQKRRLELNGHSPHRTHSVRHAAQMLKMREARVVRLLEPLVQLAVEKHNGTYPPAEYVVTAYSTRIGRCAVLVEITGLMHGTTKAPVPPRYFHSLRPTTHLRHSVQEELALLLPRPIVESGVRVCVSDLYEGEDRTAAFTHSHRV